jgi:SpoVK/Ycf46/Vps4 family AAA+-type ATPase
MSDTAASKTILERYAIGRIPFVTINTIEQSNTLDILQEVAESIHTIFYVHTLSKGIYELGTGKVVSEDKSVYSAIDYMSDQMKNRQGMTLVLTEPPDLINDNADAHQMLDLVSLAIESGGQIIVITNYPVWNQLQRMGMIVTIDLPNEEEMYELVHDYIDSYRDRIPIEWDDDDVKEATAILVGVSRTEAANVISALIAKKEITKADMDEVRQAKTRLFSDISGLEKISVSDHDKDVGGLAGLQRWLEEKQCLFTVSKMEKLRSMGLRPPRGILLVGVPGCGKSLSAKSISAKWKLPLYRLDFATVQGSYVGQSEQQLKNALTAAENVSPCILWIDEIEKGLSGAGSSNDGSVSTRMVGQFLFWLQECKKQVFVVATANDVSMLPSELLRRGRFDELFFVDLPTVEERQSIISLYMRKYLGLKLDDALMTELVDITDGFTGADLESTVRDLAYHKLSNEGLEMTRDLMTNAFNNVIPLSQTSPEKIEGIRAWGKTRAVPASGRPIGSETLKEKAAPKVRRVLV